jgi:uncharacterized protein YkwD
MRLKFAYFRFLFLITLFYTLTCNPGLSQEARIANNEEIQAFLQIHNQYRQQVGVDSLTWSNELAEYALEWAKALETKYNCKMRHRPRKGEYAQKYGENLFIMYGAEPDIEIVLTNWGAEEKKYYNGEAIGSVKSNKPTGHYTQIVWKTTQKVGCARIKCAKTRPTYIWVCNYDPPGNWIGEKPY